MNGDAEFLNSLTEHMRAFSDERDWQRLQTPKNLAMALAGEAGELVAEFQWLTPEESERANLSPERLDDIEAEMADVLIYLVQLADRLGTDLPEAVRAKMARNAIRFPPSSPTTT